MHTLAATWIEWQKALYILQIAYLFICFVRTLGHFFSSLRSSANCCRTGIFIYVSFLFAAQSTFNLEWIGCTCGRVSSVNTLLESTLLTPTETQMPPARSSSSRRPYGYDFIRKLAQATSEKAELHKNGWFIGKWRWWRLWLTCMSRSPMNFCSKTSGCRFVRQHVEIDAKSTRFCE